MVKVREDLTNKIFGRLTVIKQVDDYVTPSGQKKAQWLCECSCIDRNQIIVVGSHLKNGNTQSCGCIQKEKAAQTWKEIFHKTNKYDLSGEYGIGWTTNTNQEFYFDLDRFNEIKDFCWVEHILTNGLHRLEAYNPNTKKPILMHTLLGYHLYDHIDRNELNNRSCNLRPATQQQNCCNRSIQSNNSSGIIGVNFNQKQNMWHARIGICGKRIHLGFFHNKNDAIKTRLQAEIKYFGEFAPQQHLFLQYGINLEKGDNNE